MYKKLFMIICLITALVLTSGSIGFRIFDEVDEAEVAQARALTILKNVERLHAYAAKLGKLANEFSATGEKETILSFRGELDRTLDEVNKQVFVLHNGDCKSCHSAALSLKPEFKSLQGNLAGLDNDLLSGAQNSEAYERKIQRNLAKLTEAAITINKLSNDELRRTIIETNKAPADRENKAYVKVKRDRVLTKRSEAILLHVNTLKKGIDTSDGNKVQFAVNNLAELVRFEPITPPLKGDCYSCHYTIASLPDQVQEISKSVNGLLTAKQDTPPSRHAVGALRASLEQFEGSNAKMLELARRDAARSMKESKQVRSRLKIFMVTLEALVILVFVLSAVAAARWVRKRLSSFSRAMAAISEGDYSYIIDAGSNDEVADMAHAFNLMVGKVRSSQEMLKYLNEELRELHINTVKAFVAAIEAKDPYTRGHSENVAKYSLLIGQQVGLSTEELESLHVAALLHDIGKIGVHEDILNKPVSLTDEEYERIKMHPVISAQIVGSISNLAHIATTIQFHHERFDGSGYTEGLAGESIPLGSRIIAIADAFDAMTSDRPYRDGCSIGMALEEITQCSGTQFDPMLVECFVKAVEQREIADRDDALSA